MSYAAPKTPWWVVAKREVMAKITDKAFWLSTLAVLAVIAISFGLSFMIQSGSSKATVGVADEAGTRIVNAAAHSSGKEVRAEQMPTDELEQAVKDDKVDMALVATDNGWQILVKGLDTNTDFLEEAITQLTLADNAQQMGVDLNELNAGTKAEVRDVNADAGDESGGGFAFITGLVFALLFMMSTMTYGLQIAQSVAEEKESRLVEILTSAVSTRDLLIGKVLGNTIMALGQLVLIVGLALIGLQFTEFKHYLPMLLPGVGWFILFFLVGFAALGCLWAGAGAMASRVQDTSNTTTPLIMLVMVVYVLGFSARGSLAQVMSYVPIASSVVMPQRVVSGEAEWWEALISLGVCLLFMVLTIRLGAYIYRRGLNRSGGVMKLGELFRRN